MAEVDKKQMEAMQEKLKNMSPEELKEFQKQRCIFCQIISGKVASKKVYSDKHCTAILDINPANPGHILLIPNEHYGIMPLMPPEIIKHMFMVAKALAQASLKALEAQGTNIFVANGLAAGQKAQHFMIHIIPRKEGDKVPIDIPENDISAADLKQLAGRIISAIEKVMGKSVSGIQPTVDSSDKTDNSKLETDSEPEDDSEVEEVIEETEESFEPEDSSQSPVNSSKRKRNGEFITSEKARRFHSNECPFAQNIKEDSRLYISKNEAEEMGKLPCSCTGLRKSSEHKVSSSEKNKIKKTVKKTTKKTVKKKSSRSRASNSEKKSKTQNSKPKTHNSKLETDEPVTLDDISSLLTGGGK